MKSRSLTPSWLLFLLSLALLCATMWFSLYGHSATQFAGLNPADYSFLHMANSDSDASITAEASNPKSDNRNTLSIPNDGISNDVAETPVVKLAENAVRPTAAVTDLVETTSLEPPENLALSEEGEAEAKLEAGRLTRLEEDRQAAERLRTESEESTKAVHEKTAEGVKSAQVIVVQEKATQEEAAQEEVAQEEAAQEEVAQEEVAQEEVAQEEVAQEEVAQEEVAQEEVAQEEVAQEEVAQAEVTEQQAVVEVAAREKLAQENAEREKAERDTAAMESELALQAARKKAAATRRLVEIAEFEKGQAEMVRLTQVAETSQAQEETAILMLSAEKARQVNIQLKMEADALETKRISEQSVKQAKAREADLTNERLAKEAQKAKSTNLIPSELEKVQDEVSPLDVAAIQNADKLAVQMVERVPKELNQTGDNHKNMLKPNSIAALRKQELAQLSGLADQIVFSRTRWDIGGDTQAALDGIFEILFLYPDVRVQVFVRSGDSKDSSLNDLLSMQRTKAIAKYLVNRGLDPSQTDVQVASSTNELSEDNVTSVVELWVESSK